MERNRSPSPSRPTVPREDYPPPTTTSPDDDNSVVIIAPGRSTQEGGGGDADGAKPAFSFRALPRGKKWTLIVMAFANFAACTCFSLLAPFFPKEVSVGLLL
jgi:hypothetical protein